MNTYRTQRTWAVPLLAAISLLMLNFTDSLVQRDPMAFLNFLQVFGFRPELLVDTWLVQDFRGMAAVLNSWWTRGWCRTSAVWLQSG